MDVQNTFSRVNCSIYVATISRACGASNTFSDDDYLRIESRFNDLYMRPLQESYPESNLNNILKRKKEELEFSLKSFFFFDTHTRI